MSLLSFGEVLVDLLANKQDPTTYTQYAGGAPANVAVAYAKLGGESYFIGMLGNDFFGHFLQQSLQDHQVNTEYCLSTDQAKTALAFVALDTQGERQFTFYRPPAADLLFEPEHFSINAFTQAHIFHICSNSLTEQAIYRSTLYGLKLAKKSHCIRSFDINLRVNLWSEQQLIWPRIKQVLKQVDIVKVSQEELDKLCQLAQLTQEQWFKLLFQYQVRLVVITDGANPIRYRINKIVGEIYPPTVHAVDTTAAGDAFTAGLLYQLGQTRLVHWLQQEGTLREALKFAAYCGALACEQYGAFAALPTLEQLHQRMQNKEKS